MKLTKRSIDALPLPETGDRLVFDDDLTGFALRITAKGARVFLFQYWAGGRNRRLRLGAYGDLTPAQARDLAQEARLAVAAGRDPVDDRRAAASAREKRAAADAFTAGALIDAWTSEGLRDRRPRYRAEAARALRAGLAQQLGDPADTIDAPAARKIIQAIAVRHPPMARRTQAYARAAWGWAIKAGRLDANPFQPITVAGREVARDRALNDAELGEVWRAAAGLGWPFGPYLQFLILTLQRREEVAAMRWSELSPDRTVWTVPAERAKNGKAHIVHLAPAAQAILAAAPRVALPRDDAKGAPSLVASPYVFTTTGTTPVSGFSRSKAALDAAIMKGRTRRAAQLGEVPAPLVAWRLHDLRRTGATTLARLGVDWAVADRLLNHVTGAIGTLAGVYQLHEFLDERRDALDRWAAHVTKAAGQCL